MKNKIAAFIVMMSMLYVPIKIIETVKVNDQDQVINYDYTKLSDMRS